MHSLKSALFGLVAAVISCVAFAAPHDPGVTPSVVATPDLVSLRRTGIESYASFLVTIQNGTTNNLNFVSLTGTTFPQGTSTATAAKIQPQGPSVVINLVPATNPGCQLTNDYSINCAIGTLAPGGNMSFVVVVEAPTAGQKIEFFWTFTGSEGNSTGGCCVSTGTATTTLVDAEGNDSVKKHVQSFVKPGGGAFFTGTDGIAKLGDPWTTTVAVPGFTSLPYTTADVLESVLEPSCSAINLQCNQTALTIPGTFSNLLITLQQHPSIIKNGSKIENWVISYSHDLGVSAFVPLLRCDATNPVGPSATVPCIDICKEYTKKSDPLNPEKWGIFECKIKALSNGGYKVQ